MAREELSESELARLQEWESERSVEEVRVTVSSNPTSNRRFALWSNVTTLSLRSGSSGIEGDGFSFESALAELTTDYDRVPRND